MNENDDLEKKAIERHKESVEESPVLNIEQPKNWLLIITILSLIGVLIFWSIFGRIPTEATGRAVSISSAGVSTIESPSSGMLTELFVSEGETFMDGAPLAKFRNPKLLSLISSIEATKFKIERLNNQALLLQKALAINVSLFKQGLIAKMVIDQSRSNYMEKQVEIEDTKSSLSSLFTELEKNAFAGEKFPHYKKLLEAPPKIIQFSKILNDLSTLYAPCNGRILEVLANTGEQIENSESIFWVEKPSVSDCPEIFYATVAADVEGRFKKGLKVLIEPANVNPKEYGAIIGNISDIYRYPVSEAELIQSVGNKQIVAFLLQNGKAKIQITVSPQIDPKTKSGYKWTSGDGPPYAIPTGTVCKIRVIVDEQPPISYLIPLWKVKPQ